MAEAELRVLFIGAGAVNFGAAATALAALRPWNHSRRLEKEGGVRVVAIADPDLPKAKQVYISSMVQPCLLQYLTLGHYHKL